MRKIVILLLLTALLLCGCGQKETPAVSTVAAATAPPETTSATVPPTTLPPETEPQETEPPETEPVLETEPADPILLLLQSMTLEEKICQMFIVAPEQLTGTWQITEADEDLLSAIADYPVGGLIYFSENLIDREQTAALLADTMAAAPIPLFQCVDEEGGTIARIANNPNMGTTVFPDMMQIMSAEEAYTVGSTIGAEIKELGFNLDFAPVADVMTNPYNRVIGSRAFGTDPEITAQLVSAAVRGFRDCGMVCCLKHFPGHGNTDTDSHYGFAFTWNSPEGLRECEFLPFAAGIAAGAPMVMIGHICTPEITDDDTPASLSGEIVTGFLRKELGFEGLCITDALQMGAITTYCSNEYAVIAAVEAGNDILLMPEDFYAAYDALLNAVLEGRIPEDRIDESVLRILRCKAEYGILPGDILS